MNDRELMRAHIDALFTHDADERLLRVNVPDGADAPRFFLGSTRHGNEWRVRHDVSNDLVDALRAAGLDERRDELMPYDVSKYERVLGEFGAVNRTWVGPAFRFPAELPMPTQTVLLTEDNADLLEPHLVGWRPDISIGAPLFARVVDGKAVAVCGSVRITAVACEAGVETVPEYRGQGHATHAVIAWANAVRAMGVLPLYSTSWQNTASRAVARKLGLVIYGTDLHIT